MNIREMIKDNERLIDSCKVMMSQKYLLSFSEIGIARSRIVNLEVSNSLLEEILKM